MHAKTSAKVSKTVIPATTYAEPCLLYKAQQARIEALQAEVDELQKTLG